MNSSLTDKLRLGLTDNSLTTFVTKALVYGCLYSSYSNTLTATPYWQITSRYHRRAHATDLRAFDVDIDPFGYRWVDPREITRFSGRDGVAWSKRHIGRVTDGRWDQTVSAVDEDDPLRGRTDRFDDHIVYRSLYAHFVDDEPWENTAVVEYALAEIDRGNRCWGSSTRAEVFERCARLDELYAVIERDGYRTKQELLGITPRRFLCRLDPDVDRHGSTDHITRTSHHPVRGFRSIRANEIMVDIGRDGEILFVDGRHRLTIAKLLELDRIPVIVTVRHREWVEKIASGDLDGVESHPDIEAMENE